MAHTSKTVEKPRDLPTADSAKKHDYDLSDSENDAQLQLLKQKGPQWEGFGDENIEDDDDDDDDDDESVDVKMDQDDDVPEKDDSEEELERLVFGDTAGFREGLRSFALEPAGAALNSETDEEADKEGLGNVADKDLFFFDSGPGVAPAGALPVAQDGEDEEEGDKPAWGDSDDEKLAVSLASVPRLRKLRETEADDVVSGREYVRRLRKQYQRLYPTPDWALQATGKSKRKRTRTAEEGESEEESASDMDVDDDDLSTQPLARLLKDADILSRVSNGPAKRRKLQAGTVSIQRLKDVSSKGPVCALFHLSRDMLTHTSSLPLPRFLSTLPILYCFHLGRARLCPCITSMPTPPPPNHNKPQTTTIHYSRLSTSSAPPLPLPPSTPRLLTLASSSVRVVVISTSGIYRRAR
jgi:U3 small nucleolar RNA-associated protein 18